MMSWDHSCDTSFVLLHTAINGNYVYDRKYNVDSNLFGQTCDCFQIYWTDKLDCYFIPNTPNNQQSLYKVGWKEEVGDIDAMQWFGFY